MTNWQNRIVEFGVKKADQFTANPANPRIHPQFQRDVMRAALDRLGWIAPVIENRRTGYLVDGHERVMSALEDNRDVPYVVVDLSEDDESFALATFDPVASLASYEQDKLVSLLEGIAPGSDAMSDFFSDFFSDDPDGALETARQLPSPVTHSRQSAKRDFINGMKREALSDLIPTLPPPDTDLYIVGNGSGAEVKYGINPKAFDFGSFVPVVVRLLGDIDCTAYISTWTMNRNHARTFLQMLDDKRLKNLSIITGTYFKRRESSVYAELVSGIMDRGQRFLTFANHCKVISLANPAGDTCVITGSANLSAQPRAEQYVLTTSPDVYRFFVTDFFEAIFNGNQTNQG